MKHIRRLLVLSTAFLVCSSAFAQENAPTRAVQLEYMAKLKPMIGTWRGQGWIEMGPRRFEFESTETFAEKAGGLAIVVEGQHHMPLPGGEKRTVHNAVALIRFDGKNNKYQFISQLANGRAGDYSAVWTEDGNFQWTIPETPAGTMKYTISVTGNEYREIGELISASGGTKKFFEMKLQRTP